MNVFDQFDETPLEEAAPEVKARNVFDQFDKPGTAKPSGENNPLPNPEDDSFLGTLKNPWKLWTEESIGAHLYGAYKEGTFNKPLKEIVKGGAEGLSETAKKFKMSELVDAVSKHPGKMLGELVNIVVADPELLLPMFWEGLGGRLGVAGLRIAGKAGQVAGRMAEIGGTLGVVGGVESAAKQLDEAGFIDTAKLAKDMGTSATFGAALGGVLTIGGLMLKSKPSDIAAMVQSKVDEGVNPLRAAEEVLRESGVSGKKAREMVDTLEPYRDENALEAIAAKERIATGEAKEIGTEPSALAAREEFLNAKRSLTPSQAKELDDIKHYREVLPELDIEPRVADAMTPKEAKAIVEERAPMAPLETFVKAEAPKVLDEAQRFDVVPSGFKERFPEDSMVTYTDPGKAGVGLNTSKDTGKIVGYKLDPITGDTFAKVLNKNGKIEFVGDTNDIRKVLPPGWKERGFLDPGLAKYAVIALSGAALGSYLSEDKAKGAVLGASLLLGGPIAARAAMKIAGSGIERIKASTIGQKVGKVLEKRDFVVKGQVDEILRAHEGTVGTARLEADRTAYAIKKLVPEEARRGELIHAIQSGRVADLAPNERAAAEAYQKTMAELGDWAQKEGVLDSLIEDGTYVTQLWKDGEKARSLFSGMSGESRFAEDRLIPSYKMGIDLGLEPKTLDLAEISTIYANSIAKSVANKRLLEKMGGEVLADGRRAKISAGEWVKMKDRSAYSDFESVNHPQLFGAKIHPELAPSLKHFFYSTEIPAYVQAAAAVSAVAKRGLFMLSGFHVKSLADEALGIAVGLGDKNVLTKVNTMYKMIKEGKAGDFASQMVKNGMEIKPHTGIDMDNDIFRSMASTIEAVAKDLPIPGIHLPVTAVKNLDAGIQFTTWEYFHPSIKLSAASSMYEKALLQGDKRAPDIIQREIATAVNDLFGGLNWREVADGVQNKMLSSLAHSLTTPGGLRTLRILMTAPDWTLATARAGYKGVGATVKKLSGKPLNVREQLYMRAFLGNAVAYLTLANGLNYALSGKPIWENKDWTYVEMKDGRKVQLNKHFMEPVHDLLDPAGAILNKMGYVVKEPLEQLLGKEYLTSKRGEGGRQFVGPDMKNPSIPGRIAHAAKGVLPIPTQQSDIFTALAGSAGIGIYGKSEKQKRMEKRKRDVEKRQRDRELTKRREGKRR